MHNTECEQQILQLKGTYHQNELKNKIKQSKRILKHSENLTNFSYYYPDILRLRFYNKMTSPLQIIRSPKYTNIMDMACMTKV